MVTLFMYEIQVGPPERQTWRRANVEKGGRTLFSKGLTFLSGEEAVRGTIFVVHEAG